MGRVHPARQGTAEVTDDEAFIRTILASPGDDAPRLVYADWLEERGDERGAYFRLEVKWAKTRDNGLETRLKEWAAMMSDSVWTARISRSPVGVCSEIIEVDPNEDSHQTNRSRSASI